jgi:hypothetical protein
MLSLLCGLLLAPPIQANEKWVDRLLASHFAGKTHVVSAARTHSSAKIAKQHQAAKHHETTKKPLSRPAKMVFGNPVPWTQDGAERDRQREAAMQLERENIRNLMASGQKEVAAGVLEADLKKFPFLVGELSDEVADMYLSAGDPNGALRVLEPMIEVHNGDALCRASLALTMLNTVYPGQEDFIRSRIVNLKLAIDSGCSPDSHSTSDVMLLSYIAACGGSENAKTANRYLTKAWQMAPDNPYVSELYCDVLGRKHLYSSELALLQRSLPNAHGELSQLIAIRINEVRPFAGGTLDRG